MKPGFIGLGNMGSPMCRNLLTAGYDVAIHDIRRARRAYGDLAGEMAPVRLWEDLLGAPLRLVPQGV
ncbi:MAG: NAD(P)-binding domain-containing protein [Actinoallomurus sp.]